jgi:hypothetical protein
MFSIFTDSEKGKSTTTDLEALSAAVDDWAEATKAHRNPATAAAARRTLVMCTSFSGFSVVSRVG